MDQYPLPPVILDNGTDHIKAGFAKDQLPCLEIPCIIGRYKHICMVNGLKPLVGYEALKLDGILRTKNPIENGIITNWDDMELVWWDTFYRLRVAPEENPVLLTDTQINSKANREKIAQIMFETYNIPRLCMSSSAKLSLFGTGRTTGIVLESGHAVSQAIPVFNSNPIPEAIQPVHTCGALLTDYLYQSLDERYGQLLCSNSHQRNIVRDIKEELTHVSQDYQRDMAMTSSSSSATSCEKLGRRYELPDGKYIYLDKELFSCPEALFQPSLLLSKCDPSGIHQSIYSSINMCDMDTRKHLYANIVLSGGNCMFPGIRERLEKEISFLAPSTTSVRVIAPAERKYLAWMGGALIASLSTFKDISITIWEYDEWGPCIIHRKYF
ncbi:hypothetical protein LOD99_10008 [Oopsacas minuta]|uniref:Actin n=1 Tax=Oopsacas minuta TaxID=111878 RepID=A0AAV7KIT4_9METZ|nr:hypothetical protein LOD99_10008 [Oopsacas minuta]